MVIDINDKQTFKNLMKKRKEKVPQPDAEQHKAQTGRD
jgi:carbamoylphosphate synthase large subunit